MLIFPQYYECLGNGSHIRMKAVSIHIVHHLKDSLILVDMFVHY